MLRIILCDDHVVCNEYCNEILSFRYRTIGLDSEFTNGKCSLIQICVPGILSPLDESIKSYSDMVTEESLKYCDFNIYTVYLFHISKFKIIPGKLSRLLTCSELIKVGCGINRDAEVIYETIDIKMRGYIDNQSLAISKNYKEISMDSLANRLFGLEKLSIKHKDVSWSETLSENMIKYSAYDAYLSLIIYYKLIDFVKPENIYTDSNLIGDDQMIKDSIVSTTYDLCTINSAHYALQCLKKTSIFKGNKDPTLISVINSIKTCCRNTLGIYPVDKIDEVIMSWINYLCSAILITHNNNRIKLL